MKTSPKAVKRQPTMLTPFPVSRGSSESRAIMGFSRGWPFSERPPEIDELAEMIGVVVRHEQRFAQDRLAVLWGTLANQSVLGFFTRLIIFSRSRTNAFQEF